ncbi:MAG: ATP synthase F1 subunit delta [Chloroflexi bacterium]|nr:ATP synthase F1 subunit delta [Chloroflexota bacterium]
MLDIATRGNSVAAFQQALQRLAGALDARALRRFRDPSIPLKTRLELAQAVASGQPREISALLQLLVQRDRIMLLPGVAAAFGDLVDRREGIAKAQITTAVALDEATRRAFVDRLQTSSGKKLRATFGVDPSLIGGATVQVGDHLVDTSVRAKLSALRTALAS